MTFEKDTNAPKIQQPDDIADFPDFTKMMFDKVPRAPEIVVTVPTAALISTQNIRETSPAKELQPPVNPQYIKEESPPKSPEMYMRDLSPAMQENSLAVESRVMVDVVEVVVLQEAAKGSRYIEHKFDDMYCKTQHPPCSSSTGKKASSNHTRIPTEPKPATKTHTDRILW